MFTKEELKELKRCVNNMICNRQTYKPHLKEDKDVLKTNEDLLLVDYRLVAKIIKILEGK